MSPTLEKAAVKNRYPNTVLLYGDEIPEKYRAAFHMALTKIKAHLEYVQIGAGPNTTNITVSTPLPDFLDLPAECRVWHRTCAKRAGLKEWFFWKVDRDVCCHGCGRKLARRADSKNAYEGQPTIRPAPVKAGKQSP